MKKILLNVMVLAAAALFLQGCGKTPLFDELAENRLKVVLKGTYESNNPGNWIDMGVAGADVEDDSFDLRFAGLYTGDMPPTKFRLDIAEMRLKEEKFGIERQLYTCTLDDTNDFFDGTGVEFDNDDVPSGYEYSWVNIYIRKMIFDGATSYSIGNDTVGDDTNDSEYFNGLGVLTQGDNPEVDFDVDSVDGYDFNIIQMMTYYDTLRLEWSTINTVFPLRVPVYGDFVYDRDEKETVLEIRFVIKNFIKKYEIQDDEDLLAINHYYALSDWLYDIKRGDVYKGGNLLAIARAYVKGKTADISGTTAAIPGLAVNDYVVAILADDDISIYEKPSLPRPAFDQSSPLDEPVWLSYFISDDMGATLDRLLQIHRYKKDYDTFIDYIDDELTYVNYTTAWTAYNDEHSAFRIPPLATRVLPDGSFLLTNVPIGKTYKLYYASAASVGIAELPAAFNVIDETVDVPESAANTTVTVPTP